jgi:hypothetical protein
MTGTPSCTPPSMAGARPHASSRRIRAVRSVLEVLSAAAIGLLPMLQQAVVEAAADAVCRVGGAPDAVGAIVALLQAREPFCLLRAAPRVQGAAPAPSCAGRPAPPRRGLCAAAGAPELTARATWALPGQAPP